MSGKVKLLAFTLISLALNAAYAEEPAQVPQVAQEAEANDARQLVSMPEQTRRFMREDMLDHLSAVNEIIGYLAANDLASAAEVAETRMGKSSMGKYRATGMGPGRFMPLEMRNIGWGMHDAASELSLAAKQGDLKAAYSALQNVTAACVGCHYTYRTQ